FVVPRVGGSSPLDRPIYTSIAPENSTTMTMPWGLPDFDAHEAVHFVADEKSGLKAIIAIHSTHLGPAGGGCRFWHYAKDKEAVKWALGKDSLNGLHIALQGAGSVASGVALHACAEGAKLTIADVDPAKAQKLADRTGGKVVSPDEILGLEADVLSPCALGA